MVFVDDFSANSYLMRDFVLFELLCQIASNSYIGSCSLQHQESIKSFMTNTRLFYKKVVYKKAVLSCSKSKESSVLDF